MAMNHDEIRLQKFFWATLWREAELRRPNTAADGAFHRGEASRFRPIPARNKRGGGLLLWGASDQLRARAKMWRRLLDGPWAFTNLGVTSRRQSLPDR